MISILTTVYNNDKFIKEALDSFIESCGDIEYEILVGIDKCELSLNNLLQLYPKLNKNIKIFYFTDKVGTYVIRNTLAKNAKFDNLIFFDSDDIMRKSTVVDTIKTLQSGYDFFRFGFIPFSGKLKISKDQPLTKKFSHHFGAFGIKKNVFLEMNGFEPWICAADGEFFWRLSNNNYKILNSKEINILYRRHDSNLTSGPSTGMGSPLRKKYHKIKDNKIKNNIKTPLSHLSTSVFTIIDDNFYLKYEKNGLSSLNLYQKQISIIIPTYNTPNYLNDCLISVIESIKDINSEILVGIDNCEKTKYFIENNDFDSRIKFFYFEKNVGPYVLKNSLSKISNSDILLFFDSDDIMKDSMIHKILQTQKTNEFVKPMYSDFDNDKKNINLSKEKTDTYGEGVFSIKKSLFLGMNGFEDWRCAADSDFMKRLYKNNKKFNYTDSILFYRRVHSNNLTNNPETNFSSELRAHYFSLSKNKTYFGPLPELITESYIEIYPKNYIYGSNSNSFQLSFNNAENEKLEIISKLTLKRQTIKPIIQESKNSQAEKKEYVVIDNTPVVNNLMSKRIHNKLSQIIEPTTNIVNVPNQKNEFQKKLINDKRTQLNNQQQKIVPDGFKKKPPFKKGNMNRRGGSFDF